MSKCWHSTQEIFPKVTNSLDFDEVFDEAEVTLLSAAPGRHESKPWPLVLLRFHSYDCTQLYGNCLKFVHGIISVQLIMLAYDSLQASCCMSGTWGLRGHNVVSALAIACFDHFLFWLYQLFCLLCSKDLCVPISPTSMHSILTNYKGLQIFRHNTLDMVFIIEW